MNRLGGGLRYLATNSTWLTLCLPGSIGFHRATRNVQSTQQRLLLQLIRRNARTEFGRLHGFGEIGSAHEYQARVPIMSHDDYVNWIERVAAGRDSVLTRDPVHLLEPTSGSTAATKLIPYTESLKAEFGRAIAPWITGIFRANPKLMLGPAYWSVTPVIQRDRRSLGGIPIGFEEDAEYLSRLQAMMVDTIMAVPPEVKLITNMSSFRYATLLFLLRCRSLALVSVWNPTFFSLLVEPLDDWWPQLTADIEQGTVSPPAIIAPDLLEQLQRRNHPDRRRADEIRAICTAATDRATRHHALWPRLGLISCWSDALAARYAAELASDFPHAHLQGKGLLATEGVVSFPIPGRQGAALAIRSHFFEFLPTDHDGPPLLAHEVLAGEVYSVVISTGGGLYRYRLGDLVEVVGFLHDCPLLRFVGKEAHVSDRFGEKLDERHVDNALTQLLASDNIEPRFVMLAYEEDRGKHAYTLFIEADHDDDELRLLGERLDTALRENVHYSYCRDLGQLDAVRVFHVEYGGHETYLSVCQTRGQRAGDIKPVALHHLDGWSNAFAGRVLENGHPPRSVHSL